MKQALSFFLLLALAIGCGENGPAASPRVLVSPLLDSMFVGDTAPGRFATYIDARGDTLPSGSLRWSSSDTTIAKIDSISGKIVGRGAGAAVVSARSNGVTGSGLVVVSRTLALTLLLDTIYLMPGDTFTVPVSVQSKSGSPPPVRFQTSSNGVFLIDSLTGRINAIGFGGPLAFTAHADTVTATGAVEVVQLTDTVGGKGFFSVLGTVIRRDRSGARGVNYKRQGDTVTFRVSLPVLSGGVVVENMLITLRDSVHAVAEFPIDSISPNQAFAADPICRPPRPWALWSIQTNPPLRALSRMGGTLSITQIVPINHGRAISGRFVVTAQRTDLYDDSLAALPIRGTFVAPLITDPNRPCR